MFMTKLYDIIAETTIFIPAKASSKRIPRKNFRDIRVANLEGLNLLDLTRLAAHQLDEQYFGFKQTVISYEDKDDDTSFMADSDFNEISIQRESNATGDVPIEVVIKDFYKHESLKSEHILLLQPTSPFRTFGTFQLLMEAVYEHAAGKDIYRNIPNNTYYPTLKLLYETPIPNGNMYFIPFAEKTIDSVLKQPLLPPHPGHYFTKPKYVHPDRPICNDPLENFEIDYPGEFLFFEDLLKEIPLSYFSKYLGFRYLD